MINTLIAYDDNDFELGTYFSDSHQDILLDITGIEEISFTSIQGLDCTENNINITVQSLNGIRFIFVALTHGNNEQLISNEVYVSANNSNSFSNSFFYTCACSSGSSLGNILINNGCLVYVGYYSTVYIHEDYSSVFYKCQNFALKSFLTTEESIKTSYDKMVNYYDQEIDRLVMGSMDDVLAASSLVSNRNSLILLGDGSLTKNDFSAN
jgi:hypothetical protein